MLLIMIMRRHKNELAGVLRLRAVRVELADHRLRNHRAHHRGKLWLLSARLREWLRRPGASWRRLRVVRCPRRRSRRVRAGRQVLHLLLCVRREHPDLLREGGGMKGTSQLGKHTHTPINPYYSPSDTAAIGSVAGGDCDTRRA